jgi:hypothetical protein
VCGRRFEPIGFMPTQLWITAILNRLFAAPVDGFLTA